jgi:hypothetical protein
MQPKVLGSALVAALVLGPAQASALALLIDDFSTPQRVSDIPGLGLANESQVAAPGALGGWRDFQVNTDGGQTDATDLRAEDNILTFSNIALEAGEGFITYDGDDAPGSVNTSGLGGENFLIGPSPFFDFEVISSDAELYISVTAWDMTGNTAFYEETLPPLDQLETQLPLADFMLAPGFDWTQVGALQFYVRAPGPNLDGALSEITLNAIPLPASALLLMGGLGGLAAFGARRKKA